MNDKQLILIDIEKFLIQLLFRQAVFIFFSYTAQAMDNIKIYDSQFNYLNNKHILTFLDQKQRLNPYHRIDDDLAYAKKSEERNTRLLPKYSFAITDYQIGQHVEYIVTLKERYLILKRTIQHEYIFRTRYSMLELLDQKLGKLSLPPKKWFGNKDKGFVERRKAQLEDYLNKIANCNKIVFYKFIKQIKDGQFNTKMKDSFSIE